MDIFFTESLWHRIVAIRQSVEYVFVFPGIVPLASDVLRSKIRISASPAAVILINENFVASEL